MLSNKASQRDLPSRLLDVNACEISVEMAFEIHNEQYYQSLSAENTRLHFGPTTGEIGLFTIKKPIYSVMRFYVSVYQETTHSSDVYLLCIHFSVTCSPKKAVGGTVIV